MRIEERLMDLSPEEGARAVALGLLAEAITAAEGLSAGAGDEPLHDFRVALRRLRSALRTYRPWLEEDIRPRQEKRLKKIARSTNEARDAEVQLAWLAGKRAALAPARLRPGWELVVARCEARARRGPAAPRVAARLLRTAATLQLRLGARERTYEDAGAAGSFGGVLASLVRDQAAALSERIRAVRDAADQEGVHRARIEGKRLRYLVEPLRGYRFADASEAIAHLKRLQDVLGDLHDAHVLSGELRDALVDAAGERARRIHAVASTGGTGGGAVRAALRASPRPGLVALVGLVRDRRDALFAILEREWRAGGAAALSAEVREIAAAIEARSRAELEREAKPPAAALPVGGRAARRGRPDRGRARAGASRSRRRSR